MYKNLKNPTRKRKKLSESDQLKEEIIKKAIELERCTIAGDYRLPGDMCRALNELNDVVFKYTTIKS